MQLEEEKVAENRKLRKLENQKVGGSKTCQPSYLLTFLLFTFLLSSFSKYLCLFVFIRGFPYPWSPLAPPIRRIPDSCGKAGKLLFYPPIVAKRKSRLCGVVVAGLFPISYFWLSCL
jgi:hypothetical protein